MGTLFSYMDILFNYKGILFDYTGSLLNYMGVLLDYMVSGVNQQTFFFWKESPRCHYNLHVKEKHDNSAYYTEKCINYPSDLMGQNSRCFSGICRLNSKEDHLFSQSS